MCGVSEYLEAKLHPDGTPYLAVRDFPTDHFIDPLGDSRKSGVIFQWSDGYETDLFPTGSTEHPIVGAFQFELTSRDLVILWNAIAAGSRAVQDEDATAQELAEIHD